MADLQACQRCAGSIQDPDQRTCPHCLEPLRTRSFANREDLERYREDRRAHGADIVQDEPEQGDTTMALLLGFAATVMIVAGGIVAFGGVATGDGGRAARAIGQAVVPIALGVGLLEAARRKTLGGQP
jgi:hypothetical protein